MRTFIGIILFLTIAFIPATHASVFLTISPEIGGDMIQSEQTDNSQNVTGGHLAANLQLGLRNRSRRFATSLEGLYGAWSNLDDSYRQTQLLYGLGLRIHRFFLKGGLSQVSIHDSGGSTTEDDSAPGYWGSIGYQSDLSPYFDFALGLRYMKAEFLVSSNPDLTSNLSMTVWTLYASIGLDVGK